MDNLIALLLLLLLGWFWLDGARAREQALTLAGRACKAHELQLLDQAVMLRRLTPRWTRDGLRLRRVFRFEFSDGGIDRQSGELILVGLRLELLRLGLDPLRAAGPVAIQPAPAPPALPAYPLALGRLRQPGDD